MRSHGRAGGSGLRTLGALSLMLTFVLVSGALLVIFWQDPEQGDSLLRMNGGVGVYDPCAARADDALSGCWDEAARALTLGLVTQDAPKRPVPGLTGASGILGARRSPQGQPFLPSYRIYPVEGQHCRVQMHLRQRALEVLLLDDEGRPAGLCGDAHSLLVRLPR